jgi:biotin synthase
MKFWKLSAGTAALVAGKKTGWVSPTTAYVMVGERCRNNCRFCAQARESGARADMLSRVTWPAVPAREAADGIAAAFAAGRLKRACLQVVDSAGGADAAAEAVLDLHDLSAVPVCVSSHLERVEEAITLVAAGAERVCIALDAATPAVFRTVKEGDWQARWRLLTACAAALPGRITTHLIVGLGESEEEMVDTLAACRDHGITVGLFAFTPVKGTAWAGRKPPSLASYRRIQAARHLLGQGYGREVIRCRDGCIVGFDLPDTASLLADGRAFETSGCPDCNRPYYNERPGGVMYNFPRPLTAQEAAAAIADCQVIGVSKLCSGG